MIGFFRLDSCWRVLNVNQLLKPGDFGLFFFPFVIMADDGKFVIEKFDGSDYSWWKMQMMIT